MRSHVAYGNLNFATLPKKEKDGAEKVTSTTVPPSQYCRLAGKEIVIDEDTIKFDERGFPDFNVHVKFNTIEGTSIYTVFPLAK